MNPFLRLWYRRPMILVSPDASWTDYAAALHDNVLSDLQTQSIIDPHYWDDEGYLVLCTNKWGFGRVFSNYRYNSKYRRMTEGPVDNGFTNQAASNSGITS